MLVERELAVLLPEERRVAQARAHDPLVALAHLRRVAAFDVADGNEFIRQRTVLLLDREIALVILHGCDHDLARQREEALLEAPRNRHRPFDQRCHFIEQRRADQCAPAVLCRHCVDAGADRLAPLAKVRDDLRAQKRRLVAARGFQVDRARRVETMAQGSAPCGDPEHLALNNHVAEEQHHAMHGPHELDRARTPAHALRGRQRCDGLADQGWQQG